MAAVDTRIPLTLLTGFLGAGKTTLLNRILSEDHGKRYAVIVNEFGEIGIDNDLVVGADDDIFEMNNGCICCTVRGDLLWIVDTLFRRQRRFDAIIVETTGLADPGPVIQTFLLEESLRTKVRLDSVTTVVDAKHIRASLLESHEAAEQIALADQIVLNKTDLVPEPDLELVEVCIRRLNPLAPVLRAQRSNVALDAILERGNFDLDRIADLEIVHSGAGQTRDKNCVTEDRSDDHDHHGGNHRQSFSRVHDEAIESVSLSLDRPLDCDKVSEWVTGLVAERGQDILRAKGILDIAGEERRLVFQAVHMVLEGDFQRPWIKGEKRYSRMVFIGRNLDEVELKAAFEGCVAASERPTGSNTN